MSEATNTRGPVMRWYRDGDNIIGRMKGRADEVISVTQLTDTHAVEGYIAARVRGKSHADVIAMADGVYPDRSLPKGADEKPKRISEDQKWRHAIAAVFMAADGDSADAANAAAQALSKEAVKDHAKRTSVIFKYGEMYGDKRPVRAPALQAAAE